MFCVTCCMLVWRSYLCTSFATNPSFETGRNSWNNLSTDKKSSSLGSGFIFIWSSLQRHSRITDCLYRRGAGSTHRLGRRSSTIWVIRSTFENVSGDNNPPNDRCRSFPVIISSSYRCFSEAVGPSVSLSLKQILFDTKPYAVETLNRRRCHLFPWCLRPTSQKCCIKWQSLQPISFSLRWWKPTVWRER